MIRTVKHRARRGSITAPSSKSQLHRLLICASLGSHPVDIFFEGLSNDISATINCLNALGANISIRDGHAHVEPIKKKASGTVTLNCKESGSTLRFLLPLVGVLGTDGVFIREGRLPERPLSPFDSELTAHGMSIKSESEKLFCSGKLQPGTYTLPGNVSSQYISALLMTLPCLEGNSSIVLSSELQSKGYVDLTLSVLNKSGVRIEKDTNIYRVPGFQGYILPETVHAEGDWSNAAFFLSAGALSYEGVSVRGLDSCSAQGDRAILDILQRFGADVHQNDSVVTVTRAELHGTDIDAGAVPDLIPVLSVVAAAAKGETRIYNASRLRLKESDRILSIYEMLSSLGANVAVQEDSIIIQGTGRLIGGRVNSFNDHRIAMAAAIAAPICENDVEITDSRCVEKSYPAFWRDLDSLEA